MRAVVQRVREARVRVAGAITGEVGRGLLVLLGVAAGDSAQAAGLLAGKVARLRIFRDDDGKMNRSLLDVGGGALVVSQFTLCADTSKGNRPSFAGAAEAATAEELYLAFCRELAALGPPVARGVFGADMEVELTNMGPVTIWLDTDVWIKR